MSDAEIIPIGTGGRPGRGSGKARPSAAARNLAGSRAAGKAAAPKPARKTAAKAAAKKPSPGTSSRKPAARKASPPPRPTAVPDDVAGSATSQATSAGASSEAPRGPFTTQERHPLAGIPVQDWLDAFQVAASEVFGDDAERRLAEFLAFLRRRVEGNYVVDEYGFDREVTERFFMAALRPIAEKWFRIEVSGTEKDRKSVV